MTHNTHELSFENEMERYNNEKLLNLDRDLSKKMQQTNINSSTYDQLIYKYSLLIDEMQKRNLIKLPE